MANTVAHANSTTSREVRKALRRSRIYAGIQSRVSRRLKVSRGVVSRAASGRFPGRYKRVELAILEELSKLEPALKGLLKEVRAERNGT